MTLEYNTLFDDDYVETKVCIKCGVRKHVSEFQTRVGGEKGLREVHNRRNECKPCKAKLDKETSLAKKIAGPVPNNHICPICKRNEEQLKGAHNGFGVKRPWVLDHNHDTGHFRAWICQRCNIALGTNGFNESVDTLKNAIKYLTKHA